MNKVYWDDRRVVEPVEWVDYNFMSVGQSQISIVKFRKASLSLYVASLLSKSFGDVSTLPSSKPQVLSV